MALSYFFYRLSDLISSIISIPVTVIKALPLQESILDGNALLIMDILVQLEDGSLANVEVQKIPYMFPAERMSCYSSDLVLRQYSRVKGEKGKAFTYKDMRPVYTIIFFEKSLPEFKAPVLNGKYLHFGKTVFDTGLELELLQRFYLISLDVFQENKTRYTVSPCLNQYPLFIKGIIRNILKKQPNLPICSRNSTNLFWYRFSNPSLHVIANIILGIKITITKINPQ